MKIKHFSMVIICIVIISLLCYSYFNMLTKISDITINLTTVSGDEEILKDITIKGDISSNYYKISFSMLNTEVTREFDYKIINLSSHSSSNIYDDHYFYHFERPTEAHNMDSYRNNYTYTFSEKNIMCVHFGNQVLATDVVLEFQNSENTYYTNSIFNKHQSMHFIYTENAKYLVTLTDYSCKGTGGIYKTSIKNKDDTYKEVMNPQNVFPIDLQDGNVQILTGYAIGNKIVLVVSKNNIMFAEVFDTDQNKLITEIQIAEKLEGSSYDSVQSNGYFILKQVVVASFTDYYYVLDIVNGKVVQTAVNQLDNNYSYGSMITLYKNDTLFLLYSYRNFYLDEYQSLLLKVFAFQNGINKYEGTIHTSLQYNYYIDIYIGVSRIYRNLRME